MNQNKQESPERNPHPPTAQHRFPTQWVPTSGSKSNGTKPWIHRPGHGNSAGRQKHSTEDTTAKIRPKRHALQHCTEAQRRNTTAKGRLKRLVLLHFPEAQRIDTTAKGRLKQHVLRHFTEAQRIDTTAKGRL